VLTCRWPDRETLKFLLKWKYYFLFIENESIFVLFLSIYPKNAMKNQQALSKGSPPSKLLQRLMKPTESINTTRQAKTSVQKISDRVLSHADPKKKF
jgi:hypothetical protein